MLADYIRNRREELGLSLSQLAARANTTKGYVHQLERAETSNPSCSMICALAAGLQVSAVELFRVAAELPPERNSDE